MLFERGVNDGHPGAWFFIELIEHGFPARCRSCDFTGEHHTRVRVFVPDSNGTRPLVINDYVLAAKVSGAFRGIRNNTDRVLSIRVNRPFRFYPDRATMNQPNAIEWVAPEVDINDQVAIADDMLAQGQRPYHIKKDLSQITGIPEPTTVVPHWKRKVAPLTFKPFQYTPATEVDKEPGHKPRTSSYSNVQPPSFKLGMSRDEIIVGGVGHDEQEVVIKPIAENVQVPYTDVYQPFEIPYTRQPIGKLRMRNGEMALFRVPHDVIHSFRFWPAPLPGQTVPTHYKPKAWARGQVRTESITVPLPEPETATPSVSIPYPEVRNGVPGHLYQLRFPPIFYKVSEGQIDVNGVQRSHPAQKILLRFKPLDGLWLPDTTQYHSYLLDSRQIPTTCNAHFTLDPQFTSAVNGVETTIPTPSEIRGIRGRWFPEYVPSNVESARSLDKETFLRSSSTNVDHNVYWLDNAGNELARAERNDVRVVPDKKSVLKRKRAHSANHAPTNYIKDMRRLVVMKDAKRNANAEYIDSQVHYANAEARSRQTTPAQSTRGTSSTSSATSSSTTPDGDESDDEDESHRGAVGGAPK